MSTPIPPPTQTAAEPDSSIRRADGVEPYNHYLWPTESWWLNEHDDSACGRWHFGIVALQNGQFAVEGLIGCIREDRDFGGRRNNFQSRESAIRAAAARLIRIMRASRAWTHDPSSLKGPRLADAINWVLQTVCRETNGDASRTITIEAPEPIHAGTGLPLFDFATQPQR